MNSHLNNALRELKSAGAQGLPSSESVEKATNGKKWSGKKANEEEWELVKNNNESYNCRC
ncbi:MAG: hypothetical protein ACD_28C00063G0013 [uncultured bacterium]|nr:MAG: hypothetical protein ACD_28C00063G0013 [uncultured bacterium]KKT75104.1 MAG: hypothetical protein UW70_C0039G0035 [Candidatus Peregrinibacteria bacterium GW2011_GWA2_44_7]